MKPVTFTIVAGLALAAMVFTTGAAAKLPMDDAAIAAAEVAEDAKAPKRPRRAPVAHSPRDEELEALRSAVRRLEVEVDQCRTGYPAGRREGGK